MPDIGNTLREARIRRGLSITDVENVTKIRSKYLEALEENDFEVLPGPHGSQGLSALVRSVSQGRPRAAAVRVSQRVTSRTGKRSGPLRTEMTQQRRTQTSAERKKKRTRRTQRGYVTAAVVAIVIIAVIA